MTRAMHEGAVLADRYELLERAGGGGMGEVFRARDRVERRDVAIKLLTRTSESDHERFAREIAHLAALREPGIVRYLDHGHDERPWLATEWLEGHDLAARLREGPLSLSEVIDLGQNVARTLACAHARGVVHRDIKPSNLFLVEGDVQRVTLLDFGVARGLDASPITTTGAAVGTPSYMAPEQARAEHAVDERADLFSLGCVLYECITGRIAFAGRNAVAVLAKLLLDHPPRLDDRSDLPPSLVELVHACLAKDPSQRPADADAVAEALEQVRTERAAPLRPRITARPPPTTLGEHEQRLVAAVLTRPAGVGSAHASVTRVARLADHHRARVEELANGSIAALIAGSGSATDLARRAAYLARDLRDRLGHPRLAIATGRAVLGALPVGDAIDRAAAVLSRAEGDGIIALDETTAALLERGFEIGHAEGGPVLLGEHTVEAPARLLGRSTPFVGRARELALLEALVDEATSERVARAALVVGESGMGKTRLVRELLARLDARDEPPAVWRARCTPDASAHGLVAELVRAAAAIRPSEPAERKLRKLRSRLGRRLAGSALDRVVAFLAEAIGAPVAEPGPELEAARADPRSMGDQIRRAFEDWIEIELSQKPLLITVDDLHWADASSVEVIDRVLRNLADRPLTVIGLARPSIRDTLGEPWSARALTRVHLDGLSRRATDALVRAVIDDLDEARVGELAARSDGNPLWLEELVRAEARGPTGAAPASVLAMAQARLEGLSPAERRVLRAASVYGERFAGAGLAPLLGAAQREEIADVLEALERAEVIETRARSSSLDERDWSFRHAVLRDAAYAMLTDEDRRLGHRLAGAWLEASGADDVAQLAEHFERGGVSARAAELFQRAAERALEGDDLARAIELGERGIAAGAEGEVLGSLRLALAQAHAWRAEHGDARRWADAAMDALAVGSERWFRALEAAMTASLAVGSVDALARAEACLESTGPSRAWARATARLAVSAYQLGDDARAERLVARVEAAPEEARSAPDVRAGLHRARASRAARAGDDARMLVALRASAAAQAEAGAVRRAMIEQMNAAVIEARLGLFEQAETHLGAVIREARRMGLSMLLEPALVNLGHVHARLGRLDEAERELEEALEALRDRGDHRLTGAARCYLAQTLLRAGKLEAAEREARLGAELLGPVRPVRPFALAVLAEVLLARGKPEALEVARDARSALHDAGGGELGDGLVRVVLAEALEAAGLAAEARDAREDARTALEARAARIGDAAWRASFLERVAEHARARRIA